MISKANLLDFEETELRLGLPGGSGGGGGRDATTNSNGKRGFDETTSVDLKLNLLNNKEKEAHRQATPNNNNDTNNDPAKPPAPKVQVVGWPPVRNFRKNNITNSSSSSSGKAEEGGGGGLVKVSMDGAPYLRKVDLKMYNSYQHLSDALAKMFSCFIAAAKYEGGRGMMIDFMNKENSNNNKVMDLLNTTSDDYVPTYEDKDGDWMLVGDVPWEMFVESCKRLRIMKGTEAAGLAPRAMEKCKNSSSRS